MRTIYGRIALFAISPPDCLPDYWQKSFVFHNVFFIVTLLAKIVSITFLSRSRCYDTFNVNIKIICDTFELCVRQVLLKCLNFHYKASHCFC